ncbi:MAG: ADP-ribosylglycohydrolase family protein, partial [Cyanothece sp. SIO2G6]|nr:ADP-ribosylglycohydrolase family protein [Cyanothece sp. SIO2G6]
FGLLLGDACGVPVEFSPREQRDRDPVTGMRGYGCHHQPPGHWGDDGSLALAHVAAFLDSGEWDPEAHMMEFSAWYEKGKHSAGGRVFDIGETTSRAILRHLSGHPWVACGCRGMYDNGNGSLMRVLPVAVRLRSAPATTRAYIMAEASALTHGHRRSELSCVYFGEICRAMLDGHDVEAACQQALELTKPLHGEPEWSILTRITGNGLFSLPRDQIRSTGYVVDCLEAALWCAYRHTDFADAVLEAVNLGGDTDTTAAVCGGLAGLRTGYSGLPEAWLEQIPRRDAVTDLCNEFASLVLHAEPISTRIPKPSDKDQPHENDRSRDSTL